MANKFTALGMSGSGKTCYVLGMFNEMDIGMNGFRLSTQNENSVKLHVLSERLENEKMGLDRFPDGTASGEVTDYEFMLSYNNKNIIDFNWIDYAGGSLKGDESNKEVFEQINKNIEESSALYVFLDGDYFCDENYETRLNNVRRKCAKYINERIKTFVDSHGGKILPIIFVLTKIDKVERYTDDEEVIKIVKEAFSPEFSKGYTVFITYVSLGKDISENNYTGEVSPLNIHLPFFIGVYYMFMRKVCEAIGVLLDRVHKIDSKIEGAKYLKEEELGKHFLWFNTTNYSYVQDLDKYIAENSGEKEEIQSKLDEYKRLYNVVQKEIVRNESKFHLFIDGEKKDRLPDYNI